MAIIGKISTRNVKYSTFISPGAVSEYFITISASQGISFEEGLKEIAELYDNALQEHGLNNSTQQFTRVYFSDISNEYNKFINSTLYPLIRGGVHSLIEQSPLGAVPVSILSYHIKSDCGSFVSNHVNGKISNRYRQKICNPGKNYTLLWTANYAGFGQLDSYTQTNEVFNSLNSVLESHNMTLPDNTVRTWIYVRDIDNNYSGMVRARRELFNKVGLTSDNRFIASTGIEGKAIECGSLLSMDSLSVGNIKESQIIRMEAPQHLSSTTVYGVTFERGTKLRFGDRSHLYISGTASIDSEGHTLHIGDVRRQTERTLENIEALLEPQGASMEDMRYYIIYLRNPKHFPIIQDLLSAKIPETTPVIAVKGSVCRPGWLIEIEGVGIMHDHAEFPDFL